MSWAIISSGWNSHLPAPVVTLTLIHDTSAEWCISWVLSWFKHSHHFSKTSIFPSPFSAQVTGTADGGEVLLAFKFQTSHRHCTCGHMKEHKKGRGKILSAAMSKASNLTEQLGVSSSLRGVSIHYGSTTANCFKVKITDLTALF